MATHPRAIVTLGAVTAVLLLSSAGVQAQSAFFFRAMPPGPRAPMMFNPPRTTFSASAMFPSSFLIGRVNPTFAVFDSRFAAMSVNATSTMPNTFFFARAQSPFAISPLGTNSAWMTWNPSLSSAYLNRQMYGAALASYSTGLMAGGGYGVPGMMGGSYAPAPSTSMMRTGNPNYAPAAPAAPAAPSLTPEEAATAKELARIMTAAGVPNEEGQVEWPLGLRTFRTTKENTEQQGKIEAVLWQAAAQKSHGKVDVASLKDARDAVGTLRDMLGQREAALQIPTYREASKFLDSLQRAIAMFEGK